MPIPTLKSNPDNPPKTCTEKAVKESKEGAEWIRTAKAEHKKAIQDLHNETTPEPNDKLNKLQNLFKGLDLGDTGEKLDHD